MLGTVASIVEQIKVSRQAFLIVAFLDTNRIFQLVHYDKLPAFAVRVAAVRLVRVASLALVRANLGIKCWWFVMPSLTNASDFKFTCDVEVPTIFAVSANSILLESADDLVAG